MTHNIKEMPPFSPSGEEAVNDSAFTEECSEAAQTILKTHEEIVLLKGNVSKNPDFGLVYRVDFKTAHDGENSVNRIMLWKLPDGDLASFIGLDIPALPLES